MTGKPLVSIVLPTYNGSRYLAESVESVLAQTFSDWELIVVDDASDDETPEIVRRYLELDHRIRSIRHEVNRKLPAALNTGFSTARGRLFTWISDDNLYRPSALSVMTRFMERHGDVDVVYTDSTIVDGQGRPVLRRRAREPEEMPYWNCVGESFLMKREVHESLKGYDEGLFLVEDYDFWLRAYRAFRVCALHEDLYLYRMRRGSLSGSRSEAVSLATIALLRRHMEEQCWQGPARAMALLRIAREFASLGRRGSGFANLLAALRESPPSMFRRNAAASLALCVLGPRLFRRLRGIGGSGEKEQ